MNNKPDATYTDYIHEIYRKCLAKPAKGH